MADLSKLPPPPAGYTVAPDLPPPPAGYTVSGAKTDGHSLSGFGSNVLSSAGNFVGDLAHAVAHPIDTAAGLVKTTVGAVDKVTGGTGTAESNGLWDHLKNRYGSFDKVKETMYHDPVGFLGDLSTVAGATGAVADTAKLGKLAKVAKVASEITNPVTAPVKAVAAIPGVTAGVTAAADATKTALNRGALRSGFQTTTDAGKVAGSVEAMTEHEPGFSQAGIDHVDQLLRDLQQQKEAATGTGRVKVDPRAAEDRLDQVASKKEWQVNPNADQKQVEAVRHAFRERTGGQPMLDASGKPVKDRFGNKMFTQGTGIPSDEAQALKEGTYANNDYESTPAHRKATADAEMALARGLKEELETQIPELTGLNESQGKLLNLKGILEKAVNKYTNDGGFWGSLAKNTISSPKGALKTAGVIGSGAAMHEPIAGAAVTLMQAVLSDPAVKARLARAIGVAQQANPGKYAGAITPAARIGNYLQSLGQQQ